jgi:F0F1-type ATP synthase gamma subunit
MKKRVKEAEKLAEDRGEKINKEYFYPKKDFRNIEKEYRNMPLDPKEKIDRSILDSVIDLFSAKETPEGEVIQTSQINEIQTPPLGNTPMPVQMASNMQQKNPQTNLTRNEEALLSPTEKVIASRT